MLKDYRRSTVILYGENESNDSFVYYDSNSTIIIGHSRVAVNLIMKARPTAKLSL